MFKVFKCEKCSFQFVASKENILNNYQCGAIVEYVEAEDSEAGQDGLFRSLGIKPIGCGGKKFIELSLEEAMNCEK